MASEAVKAARGLIGRSSEPESRPHVRHEEILRYAYAVDDRRPAYLDEDAALVGAHGGIIAPPLFTGFTSFAPTAIADLRPDGLPAARDGSLQLRIPGAQSRYTGTDVTFVEPIRPGDVLTRQSTFVGVQEKQGRSGDMIFTTKEMTITNQHGRTVMIDRTTTAIVPQPAGRGEARQWDLELETRPQAESAEPPQWTASPEWEDVHEGDDLPALPRYISPVQVFFYGLVKTNSHLIHYDRVYAEREGLPERVAQGDLLTDMLCQTATRWMGRRGVLRRFQAENRAPGFIGEVITHHGRVTRVRRDDDGAGLVDLELWSEGSHGRPCVRGAATVQLPVRE